MKLYNIEVYNHAGTILERIKQKGNNTEEAHRAVAQAMIAKGLIGFSVRDVTDEIAAGWPAPVEKTEADKSQETLEQKLIDEATNRIVEYFNSHSLSAVEDPETKETVLTLLDDEGKEIIKGTLEDLNEKALNKWTPEPAKDEPDAPETNAGNGAAESGSTAAAPDTPAGEAANPESAAGADAPAAGTGEAQPGTQEKAAAAA